MLCGATPCGSPHGLFMLSRMTDNTADTLGGPLPEPGNPAAKDPEDWVTGDEPLTAAQRSYLDTLAREAGEEIPANLTKAEASEHIDRLQKKTGRGQ
jgi:hypothetical protein